MAPTVYMVSFKPNTPDAEYEAAKKQVTSSGGKILDEYSLFKGFSVELPEVHAAIFDGNPHIENVEKDQVVRTQS